ncbi:Peroxidasin [Manis javanica]|nr:Peroxidasin [Manis javanica]
MASLSCAVRGISGRWNFFGANIIPGLSPVNTAGCRERGRLGRHWMDWASQEDNPTTEPRPRSQNSCWPQGSS